MVCFLYCNSPKKKTGRLVIFIYFLDHFFAQRSVLFNSCFKLIGSWKAEKTLGWGFLE